MKLAGTVTWSKPGGRLQITAGKNRWKPLLTLYSDFNPDRFTAGEPVEIEIRRLDTAINERTNKRTNKQTNEQTNERTNKRTNEQTNKQTNEQTNKRTNKRQT